MTIRLFKTLFCFSVILLLVGCKTELYTGLTEREANQMYALLSDQGIDVEKRMVKEKNTTKVDLLVGRNEIPASMQLLTSQGYPRQDYINMGEVFVKSGMISSPMEEKARYNFALSQELRETLSRIDGVLDTRVHVVLPTETRSNETANPSTASVFIKHINSMPTENLVPKVKSLVSNSVEGLNYASVSVVLFAADPPPQQLHATAAQDSGGFLSGSLGVGLLIVLVILLAVSAGLAYVLFQKKSS